MEYKFNVHRPIYKPLLQARLIVTFPSSSSHSEMASPKVNTMDIHHTLVVPYASQHEHKTEEQGVVDPLRKELYSHSCTRGHLWRLRW